MALAASITTAVAEVPAGFISLADAAARLGCTRQNLQYRCERWEPVGLACKIGAKWYISTRIPGLADFETAEGRDVRQIGELAKDGFTATAIERAESIRNRIVLPWRDCQLAGRNDEERGRRFINQCRADGTFEALEIKHLSTRQLRQWEADYGRLGLRGLIRRPYPTRAASGFGEHAEAMFVEVMRIGHGVSVRAALDQVLGYVLQNKLGDDPAWRVPALRTVQDWWKRTVHPAAKTLIAKGPHKMRALTIPKMQRDPRIDYAAGELLIGDERTLDFMVRDFGERGWYRYRPLLTAWRDAVSGRFVGWVIGGHANSDTILAAFKQACLAMKTVPREVYIDNGLDYKAVAGGPRRGKWDHFDEQRIQTAFARLGVKAHFARPRAPWAKPIESSFAARKESDRFNVGFIGGSPVERPFDAEQWTKANILDLSTIEETRERFAAWLAAQDEEPRRSIATEGMSARQAFERLYTTRPRRVDTDTLDIVCRKLVGPVRVGRDGVRHQRFRYGTFDEEVWRLQGREVFMLVDAVERDSVILCDADGGPLLVNARGGERRFIVANVDRPLGYKAAEVRDRIRFQKRCERVMKEYAPSRDYLMKTPAAQIVERRALAAKSRQIPDRDLPSASPVESVELVRPDIAVAAAEVKRAAGAETLRRLAGVNGAAEAVNRPRPITLADLNRATPATAEEERPLPRMTLRELNELTEVDGHVP